MTVMSTLLIRSVEEANLELAHIYRYYGQYQSTVCLTLHQLVIEASNPERGRSTGIISSESIGIRFE